MVKIHFIPAIVFEILKFKNPAIWLPESIFTFNSRTKFLPECGFNRIINDILAHDLNPNNLHIKGLIFLQN